MRAGWLRAGGRWVVLVGDWRPLMGWTVVTGTTAALGAWVEAGVSRDVHWLWVVHLGCVVVVHCLWRFLRWCPWVGVPVARSSHVNFFVGGVVLWGGGVHFCVCVFGFTTYTYWVCVGVQICGCVWFYHIYILGVCGCANLCVCLVLPHIHTGCVVAGQGVMYVGSSVKHR